jgi:hypothetical protein
MLHRGTFALALPILSAACLSPDGPFVAAGRPELPLYEARPQCKEETRSKEGEIDWPAYEECMAKLGWVKQVSPSGGGTSPSGGGGGGGPSY